MKQLNDQQISDLAVHAQTALDNPALRAVLESMKTNVFEQFKACPIRDAEGLRLVAEAGRVVDSVQACLVGMLEAGKLADAKINLDSARSESRVRTFARKFGN